MLSHLRYACAVVLLLAGVSAAAAQIFVQPRPAPVFSDPVARQISDWYVQYLRRYPDQPGLAGWVAVYQARGPERVMAGILGSDEYYRLHGASDVGFIEGLFADALNRRATNWETRHWLRQLAFHRDRARLALDFLRSNNGVTRF